MSLSTAARDLRACACTPPILVHNVPIRDSRHCGSVHHLVAATITPGERESRVRVWGVGAEIVAGDKERKKQRTASTVLCI